MKKIGAGIAAGLLTLAVCSPAAAAQDDDSGVYPPTTPPYSIEIEAFGTFCLDDTPFIEYDVTPSGFTPTSQDIELRIFDVNGDELPAPYSPLLLSSFTGQFLYPGASDDPPDWPGWVEEPPGSDNWVEDPTDAIWRNGLTIQVTFLGSIPSPISGFRAAPSQLVQQTDSLVAYAEIQYPGPTELCYGPPQVTPPPNQTPPGTNPIAAGELPKTGGGFGFLGQGIALLLAGGLLVLVAARRRHDEPSTVA